MYLLGHISLLTLCAIHSSLWNTIVCEANTYRDNSDYVDLMFSDTNHGERTAEQQQVVFIDHGGGAVSQIRRVSFSQPKPTSVASPPFSPHVNHYPNSLFDNNNIVEEPFFNFPRDDIPRLFDRRIGETTPHPNLNSFPTTPPPPPPRLQHNQQLNPRIELDERVPPNPNINNRAHNQSPQSPQFQNNPHSSPFFNLEQPPQFFSFDAPFNPLGPEIPPLFQRRRLTFNKDSQDFNHNSIGYPSYTYYKGGGDDNPSLNNWPKIFKFTDGRVNLYDFEKKKKHGKIRFNSKETYFDSISRDSFLILHGGTFSQ